MASVGRNAGSRGTWRADVTAGGSHRCRQLRGELRLGRLHDTHDPEPGHKQDDGDDQQGGFAHGWSEAKEATAAMADERPSMPSRDCVDFERGGGEGHARFTPK
ncbi:hypothetical protein Xcc3_19030 [Xanthomonas campestris pv. campestris]|nr:hypothetical protein Xcc3_19030 [Xanthomonas campestris pv. campestris]